MSHDTILNRCFSDVKTAVWISTATGRTIRLDLEISLENSGSVSINFLRLFVTVFNFIAFCGLVKRWTNYATFRLIFLKLNLNLDFHLLVTLTHHNLRSRLLNFVEFAILLPFRLLHMSSTSLLFYKQLMHLLAQLKNRVIACCFAYYNYTILYCLLLSGPHNCNKSNCNKSKINLQQKNLFYCWLFYCRLLRRRLYCRSN